MGDRDWNAWGPTKVADLQLGDEVMSFGVITRLDAGTWEGFRHLSTSERSIGMLCHATVFARRGSPPPAVVCAYGSGWHVEVGRAAIAWFAAKAHAESFAAELNNNPDLIKEAVR